MSRMNIELPLLLLSISSLIPYSYQKCNTTEEKVFNLHGTRLYPADIMPVTICNSTGLITKEPINLDSYEEYLKIQGSPAGIKDYEKVHTLFSNSFKLLPKLKTLIISQVELEIIEDNAFHGLGNLLYLDLHGNKLAQLPPRAFKELTKLVTLDLHGNKLESIDERLFDALKNLRELTLSDNKLKELPSEWNKGLGNLEYLNLGFNKISILRADIFSGMEKLDRLRLHNNHLGVIEKNAFRGLQKLDSLTLERNLNITCDLDYELSNLPNLSGIALSPPNFKCDNFSIAETRINTRGIELVDIPYKSTCRNSPSRLQ